MSATQKPNTLLLFPSLDANWERLKAVESGCRRPSLGMQYVMGSMREHGYGFTYRDQIVEYVPLEEIIDQTNQAGHNIVGLHANVMTADKICGYTKALKEKTDAKVIIGGPGSNLGHLYMEAGADLVCKGEVEERLPQILEGVIGNASLAEVPGLLYRDAAGEVVDSGNAPQIKDLDTLPLPYRPPEFACRYGEDVNPAQRLPAVSVMASRGCPFRCTFCASHDVWDKKVRMRSPENVVAEIEMILDLWPSAYITFIDDIFGQQARWIRSFCELVFKKGLKFRWTCILHPLSFSKQREEIIPLMARAGCNAVSFGAQSSSPEILENIRRFAREPEELAKAVKICRENNILTIVTYIFGLPGDTLDTIKMNVDWTINHKPHLVDFHPLAVLPDSSIDRDFRDRTITQVRQHQIERMCATAFQRYYLRPDTAWRIGTYILRNNPMFIPRMLPAVKNLFTFITPQREFLKPLTEAQETPDMAATS